MNRKILTAVAGGVAALALTTSAQAHVTLQPKEVEAGGFTRLDVRVPNERDDAGTRKVVVQMPPGFASVSTEPVPGWSAQVTKRKADKPIESHGEQITEEVASVTFTGRGDQGVIEPGEFQDFGLSLRVPESATGTKLTFKALQTYQGGEVVRWIGGPDSEEPAPQVTLTAAAEDTAAPADETADTQDASAQTSATPAADEDEGGNGGNGLRSWR